MHTGDDKVSITVSAEMGNAFSVSVAAFLAAEIASRFGAPNDVFLSIAAHVGTALVAGLNGSSHWGWCYIRQLWVHEEWRRQGLGLRLLEQAQIEARARGCVGLYVDTFDMAAVSFYRRAGFTCFGRIDGFPPGHTRTFLQKSLADR